MEPSIERRERKTPHVFSITCGGTSCDEKGSFNMRRAIHSKFPGFILSALLLVLFGSFIFSSGTALAHRTMSTVAASPKTRAIPNVTCTTTPNYTTYNIYNSLLGYQVALRIGYENAAGNSGFGYCHIVAEHGTGPLNALAYVLEYGTVVSHDSTSVTIQGHFPTDGKTYRIFIVTSPILGDGYSKGIITAYSV